jgi:hypothetical protein
LGVVFTCRPGRMPAPAEDKSRRPLTCTAHHRRIYSFGSGVQFAPKLGEPITAKVGLHQPSAELLLAALSGRRERQAVDLDKLPLTEEEKNSVYGKIGSFAGSVLQPSRSSVWAPTPTTNSSPSKRHL